MTSRMVHISGSTVWRTYGGIIIICMYVTSIFYFRKKRTSTSEAPPIDIDLNHPMISARIGVKVRVRVRVRVQTSGLRANR